MASTAVGAAPPAAALSAAARPSGCIVGLVLVTGRDIKGDKHEGSHFYRTSTDSITLSASATLVARTTTCAFFCTSASLLEPFLAPTAGPQSSTSAGSGGAGVGSHPETSLEAGTSLKIRVAHTNHSRIRGGEPPRDRSHYTWLAASLVEIIAADAASQVAHSFVGHSASSQAAKDRGYTRFGDFAILKVKRVPELGIPPVMWCHPLDPQLGATTLACDLQRGQHLLAVASPFGLVSPALFHNSVTAGVVTNQLFTSAAHHGASPAAAPVFFTDARCLPGSEGGAVFAVMQPRDASPKAAATTQARVVLVGIVGPQLHSRALESRLPLTPVVSMPALLPPILEALHRRGLLRSQPSASSAPSTPSCGSDAEATACRALRTVPVSALHRLPLARTAPLAAAASSSSSPPVHTCAAPCCGVVPELRNALRSLVLIEVGRSWGSGVLVSEQGHIVTCAHLFDKCFFPDTKADEVDTSSLSQHDTVAKLAKRRVRVSVDLDDVVVRADATSDTARRRRLVRRRPRQLYSATVLYCSRGVLDLAVLRIDASISGLRHTRLPKWPHMPLRRTAVPRDGDALYAVGHGLLDPKAGASPSVYAGTAARCVWLNNKPAMVQSSALVFRGQSGGMLVSERGEYWGLITSNARRSDGLIMPDLNFCIPTPRVLDALDQVMTVTGAGDAKLTLDEFVRLGEMVDEHSPPLRTLWAMTASEEDEPVQC